MAHAIFYTHQSSGACAGMCICNYTDKTEKTAVTAGEIGQICTISSKFSSYLGKTQRILLKAKNYLDYLKSHFQANKVFCAFWGNISLFGGLGIIGSFHV